MAKRSEFYVSNEPGLRFSSEHDANTYAAKNNPPGTVTVVKVAKGKPTVSPSVAFDRMVENAARKAGRATPSKEWRD